MILDLFNNLLNNTKEKNDIKDFKKELKNYIEDDVLKQENCIYQVVDLAADGVFLRNTNNNKISKETNISKEVLDKIAEDSILRYKDGKYIYDEELTRTIF